MSQFNAQSTTDEVIQGIDLTGRVAVVTGASSGLGVETARVLAGAGARVLLTARDEQKLNAVVATLRQAEPDGRFETALMDLADLDSVRSAAARIASDFPEIHLLINNAGVMACPLGRTAQGFEMQFGTNHLGHFLFTGLLLPSLLQAAKGSDREVRIISLSSAGHRFGEVDFDDPNFERRDYNKWLSYGQSKTANALFAVGLDQRLQDKGARAFSVHPGVIMTELGRHMSQQDYDDLIASVPEGQEMTYKSVEQGSATSVWGATSPDLEGKGGLYLEDCQIAERAGPGSRGGVQAHAVDPALADRLWSLSEELVGEKFGV
jgi:NAD(P)-dependent dehydrogenase (short-subunit alcohol dehydrogenase family)